MRDNEFNVLDFLVYTTLIVYSIVFIFSIIINNL